MLCAQKQALENSLRQRLVSIRERELEYYTKNCRMLGEVAALVAGFAYSGIRYHYLLERQHSWMVQDGDALEEVIFLSILTLCLGTGLQTVLIAMLVAMLGPSLALRGPDGSLHDAVSGMQVWNSLMLALFVASLVMLQMGALSFTFGHAQMGVYCRSILSATILLTIFLTFRYARIVVRKFRLPQANAVSGAFFNELGAFQSAPFPSPPPREPRRPSADHPHAADEPDESVGLLPSEVSSLTCRRANRHLGMEGGTELPVAADHDDLDVVLDRTLELVADHAVARSGSSSRHRLNGTGSRPRGAMTPLGARLIKLLVGHAIGGAELDGERASLCGNHGRA